MVYDEGLRSYKAIAFIRLSRNHVTSKTKNQWTLSANLLNTVLTKEKISRGYSKSLGEELWIK